MLTKSRLKTRGVFRDRFMKCFSALHTRGYVAHDVTQTALAFGIALVVKGGQALDQEMPASIMVASWRVKRTRSGFFDRPGLLRELRAAESF